MIGNKYVSYSVLNDLSCIVLYMISKILGQNKFLIQMKVKKVTKHRTKQLVVSFIVGIIIRGRTH